MSASAKEQLKKATKESPLERAFLTRLRQQGFPEPVREFKPIPNRRWRVDFAWPEYGLLVEIEGGTWSGGRHTRGKGFEDDCRKYGRLVLDGWRVLRFTSGMVEDGSALEMLDGIL